MKITVLSQNGMFFGEVDYVSIEFTCIYAYRDGEKFVIGEYESTKQCKDILFYMYTEMECLEQSVFDMRQIGIDVAESYGDESAK